MDGPPLFEPVLGAGLPLGRARCATLRASRHPFSLCCATNSANEAPPQGRPWAEQDARDAERLLARLLALLRAGRPAVAAALCCDVGQPWRAAAFAGGPAAGLGLVPLGEAAAEADAGPAGIGLEALAGEADGAPGALRALWRWAAYQAAERVGGQAGAPDQAEAALYAALAGHVARLLPACATWEEAVWALARCWLEVAVDEALGGECGGEGVSLAPLITAGGGGEAVSADAGGASEGGAAGGSELGEGASAAWGRWPPAKVAAAVPRSFEALFRMADEAVGGTGAKGVGALPPSDAAGPAGPKDLMDTQQAVQVTPFPDP